jgi:uncharacterized protein YxeA
MKRLLLLLFIFIITISCTFAQKRVKNADVPQPAVKTVNIKFPSYNKVVWRKLDTLYEAEVRIGKKYSYVTVGTSGKWIETLTEIKISELPAEVADGVHTLYSSAKIKAAAVIERLSEETQYIIEFRFHGKRGVVTLDKKGKQS